VTRLSPQRLAAERLDVLETPEPKDDAWVWIYCRQKRHGQARVYRRSGRCTFCGAKVRVVWVTPTELIERP
jgi:hypothetical protein